MSQYARNNPDQSPRHEAFAGGRFSLRAEGFCAASHEPPSGLFEPMDLTPSVFGIQTVDDNNLPTGTWIKANSGNDFKTDSFDVAVKAASKMRENGAWVRVCRYPN